MPVKTIAVIGAGPSGRSIASAAACGGYRTVLEDFSPANLEDGLAYIQETLGSAVAAGTMTLHQKAAALANLSTARRVEDACREADMLIEAAPEELELKLEIFTIFDKFAKPDAILASATSSIAISDLAGMTFRAENCAGMRFFDSGPKMKLLEIVRTLGTSEATVQACVEAGRRMGREVTVVLESTPAA
jgi:3-hydroxybutyryl-CoA dehydrogenase